MDISTADETREVPMTRVADLWFDDGNIVIQAGNSLFRVMKGILAARSPFFGDLLVFAVLQPPGDCELVDGCPFVRLPDSAEDVTPFLKAIFDSSFFEPPPKKTTLADVLGVLRLSHKYDVTYLRRRALLHLETRYPTSLEAYYARTTAATFRVDQRDHVLVARAVMRVDAPWLLPCRLYDVCSGGIGSIIPPDAEGMTLDSAQTKCLAGLAQQARALTIRPQFFITLLPTAIVETCEMGGRCSQAAMRLMEAWGAGEIERGHNLNDPLSAWQLEINALSPFCNPCVNAGEARLAGYQGQWWAGMPATYGLQDWPELLLLQSAGFS